ncbi:cysteine hydrolase family protein [Aspergillus saccharolyticus JOP 1030-1]|uniref:Cysteine hydrolase family protein n=1 Tax=Aspergillus saccharolyticus JOP 1030-1 TaxID=1450539 RepID=A0A318ZNG0_9EURO|nr:cysteine hydrolase family protein [Aspergillus saccharolyticus JOP 1030-1]PYH49139.1 cysteine hydrolase family protein [Aspergillus saccharolyticus JOP 1030-1]
MMLKRALTSVVLFTAGAFTATTSPGYSWNIPSTVSGDSLSFGEHYAVLNLDLIDAVVSYVNTTTAGASWIKNTARWIDAVHKQSPPPLSIFTRIYFANTQRPEISATDPFAQAVSLLGNITDSSPQGQLYSAFRPLDDWDVVLQKVRYYAGAGNSLEEILASQKIDTVVLSGIRTSGVVINTALRLFDLNYKVYVIANNTIETPSTYAQQIQETILQGILPNNPIDVITIEQAISALNRSGPAVY